MFFVVKRRDVEVLHRMSMGSSSSTYMRDLDCVGASIFEYSSYIEDISDADHQGCMADEMNLAKNKMADWSNEGRVDCGIESCLLSNANPGSKVIAQKMVTIQFQI